ncbi:5'/3'-nucleotidase SurE [Pyrofollis japonicus]|nr:5'/3'-nucleotidase SurE [Pyrofollis japonicus]
MLITNDDGAESPGLRILYEAVKDLGRVDVYVPSSAKSACGHGMTLGKPIRAVKKKLWGSKEVVVIDGLPSDAVYIATSINGLYDAVFSGVNIGDNTSLQSILASATIGAAVHAALMGMPAAAFSVEARSMNDIKAMDYAALVRMQRVIRLVASFLTQKMLPRGIDLLSVNFPRRLTSTSRIVVAPPARIRFRQIAKEVKRDENGKVIYYSIQGEEEEPAKGTDTYELKRGNIVLTPICLEGVAKCNAISILKHAMEELNKMM